MTNLTRRTVMIGTGALMVAPPSLAMAAASHEILMLNKHPEDRKQRMVFHPKLINIGVGDTVNFVSTDKGHNCASVDDMIPEGAEAWDGKINKDIEVTFSVPGVYGYKCTPHLSVGMVGMILVGGPEEMTNLEAAMGVRHRGKAKKNFAALFEMAQEQGLVA
ncbi:MAG: pseudoazurin [Pseudomonadota bacterium]